ncbi:MAG TPA: GapR family DNA-binding domain-containing protein, partial [Urbifossiella sp.]|nr:GapR family DNA-binding domain-containing protein [Urbifossiella sp.]
MTAIGHNRTRVGGIAVDQLRSIIERVERLEEQKADIAADIREIFA